MTDKTKNKIEVAALDWARNHSKAPDQSPDWIMHDFEAGAKFGYDLAKEELNQAFTDGVKQGIEQAKEDKITFIDCIPYQLCPRCNVDKRYFIAQWSGFTTFDICNGKGIIPMAFGSKP